MLSSSNQAGMCRRNGETRGPRCGPQATVRRLTITLMCAGRGFGFGTNCGAVPRAPGGRVSNEESGRTRDALVYNGQSGRPNREIQV